jgi:heme-degrading monooxygenase HmoA
MIARIWRGWTTPQNADAYERLLRSEIVPGIEARNIPGYQGIALGRRAIEEEVEFVTIMWFESLASVEAFAGPNYAVAVVPAKARSLLARFDESSAHYETILMPPG